MNTTQPGPDITAETEPTRAKTDAEHIMEFLQECEQIIPTAPNWREILLDQMLKANPELTR